MGFAANSREELLRVWFDFASESELRQAVHATIEQVFCNAHALEFSDTKFRGLVRRLQRFAVGTVDTFGDVRLDVSGMTPFQRRVVAQARRIPYGSTLSYGELARRARAPRAARAVGSVMAQNRFPLIVPCHRVVGSSRRLGGFSAPCGVGTKRRLLRLEGALNEKGALVG